MEKLMVSVFENVFEQEGLSMSHVAIIGKRHVQKGELIKQIIGSFLQSGKRILLFDVDEEFETLKTKWSAFTVTRKEQVKEDAFTSNKFVSIETADIDFESLRNILIDSKEQWILVHNNLDELAINYEQNEFVTQKVDFLYYLSEFGRVFNLYTLTVGSDLKTLSKVMPIRKLLDNSKNLLLLQQDYPSLKILKMKKWLNDEQLEKVKNLTKYEAYFLRK